MCCPASDEYLSTEWNSIRVDVLYYMLTIYVTGGKMMNEREKKPTIVTISHHDTYNVCFSHIVFITMRLHISMSIELR